MFYKHRRHGRIIPTLLDRITGPNLYRKYVLELNLFDTEVGYILAYHRHFYFKKKKNSNQDLFQLKSRF